MSEVAEFSYGSTTRGWKKEYTKHGRKSLRATDITRAGGDRILAKRETFKVSKSGNSRQIVSTGSGPTRTANARFAAIGRQIAGKKPVVRRRKRITVRS